MQTPLPAMDYPGYEHQQDQQQQQQTYDQSQVQAYDQSSQAYYGYNQQYDQQYAYYSSQDYANSYAQQTHQQFQESTDSIHPPGVPISESTHSAQNQQNVHYLPGVVENRPNLNPGSGYATEGSINPAAAAAAVAAFSQLTQFAGNIDVAQRATQYPVFFSFASDC